MFAKDWDTTGKIASSDTWTDGFAAGYAKCDEVSSIWDKVNTRTADFLKREDAKDIMEKNYAAHKEFIDRESKLGYISWEKGVYFDTGMFLGENMTTLYTVPQSPESGFMIPAFGADTSGSSSAAQWAAGYLYGVTGRRLDLRDDIVSCWTDVDGLDDLVDQYMNDVQTGQYKDLNELSRSDDWINGFSQAMASCDKPGEAFDKVNKELIAFAKRPDAEDLMKANYQANKAFIDLETQRAVTQWTLGVYFDAGMFVGEDVATLSTVPQ